MGPATLVGNVLLLAAAVPATAAAVYYGLRVPWWRSGPWGWHLMTYMTAMALVLDLAVVRLFWGDAPWFAVLRAVAFGLTVVSLWWRLAIVVQAGRDLRHERPSAAGGGTIR